MEKDLWIDEQRGVILDAQVCLACALRAAGIYFQELIPVFPVEDILREERKTSKNCGPWWQHPQVWFPP